MYAHASPQDRLEVLRAALIETANLDTVPTGTELVGETLMADSIAYLQGASGTCKSFAALDLAGCVATGSPWHGRTAKKGRVLYVVAEGASGLKNRVRAWEEANDQPMYGVWFLPLPVQLMDPSDGGAFEVLCAELKPALIVIDTQARATVGLNENSAEEVGRLIDRIEGIRLATSACVLIVHHEGHLGEKMRGSTAMFGAAETVLRCVREDHLVTLSVIKQKDGAEPFPLEFVMTPTGASIVLAKVRKTWSEAPPRPVKMMLQISNALQNSPEPLTVRGLQDRVKGRQESVRFALAQLVDGGYVVVEEGPRRSVLHRLLAPFGEGSP